MPDLIALFEGLLDPHYAWGNFPYFLLVVSMLMRDMGWLRAIAIVAGVSRIIIRAFIVYDPVAVIWESVLVAVNIGQLLLLWWESRNRKVSDDEKLLLTTILPSSPRRTWHRLLKGATWRELEPGHVVVREGEEVTDLVFVTDGAARVERGDRIIAIVTRGDFVGEMSFISGGTASATVIADRPMRIASFGRAQLQAMLERDLDLRRGLEASFNRNLIDKLMKSTAPSPATQ